MLELPGQPAGRFEPHGFFTALQRSPDLIPGAMRTPDRRSRPHSHRRALRATGTPTASTFGPTTSTWHARRSCRRHRSQLRSARPCLAPARDHDDHRSADRVRLPWTGLARRGWHPRRRRLCDRCATGRRATPGRPTGHPGGRRTRPTSTHLSWARHLLVAAGHRRPGA